jgi:D-arabinose 1-dehydrogenase-like Zn-dependent alcohol dehydrogenase
MASQVRRQRAWNRLAKLVVKSQLASIYSVEAMSEVPRLAHEIIDGKIRGRVVIDVNA